MTAPTATARGRLGRSRLRWGLRALRAERIRATSTLGPWLLLALSAALCAGFTALAIADASRTGVPDLASAQGAERLLSAGSSAVLFATLVGVLLVTSELRHGTAVVAVTADPSRLRWLSAKLAVVAAAGATTAAVSQILTVAVGLPLLAQHHTPIDHLGAYLLGSSIGTVVVGAFAAVWGMGIGAVVRNQVAAIVVAAVWTVVVEPLVLASLPTVGRFLPAGATAAVAVDPTDAHRLPPEAGVALWLAWALVLLATGVTGLYRGDVPSGS
jgi:ABC-2 type transport system permease protein